MRPWTLKAWGRLPHLPRQMCRTLSQPRFTRWKLPSTLTAKPFGDWMYAGMGSAWAVGGDADGDDHDDADDDDDADYHDGDDDTNIQAHSIGILECT